MDKQSRVISVNISDKKGVIKEPVKQISINEQGVVNDAHAGDWHRQISLLAEESIMRFTKILGRNITYGEFAENITTKGIVLYTMTPGDILYIGDDVILEVTQIGKKCHGEGCAIFSTVGKCVMPKEGIFCKVLQNGLIKNGDTITHIQKQKTT